MCGPRKIQNIGPTHANFGFGGFQFNSVPKTNINAAFSYSRGNDNSSQILVFHLALFGKPNISSLPNFYRSLNSVYLHLMRVFHEYTL